jgi:ENTS family enterobactin (siderophore) exporter
MGLGIAISSFVVMRKGNMKHKGAAFQRALICGSTITILTGRTTEMWQVLVLSFAMGLAGGFYINMNQGLIQANTPQPLMGRVMGLYALTSFGIMPFGALLLGVVASWTGPGAAISGAAAVCLAVVVTTYVRQRELRELA